MVRELNSAEVDMVGGGFLPILILAVAAVALAGCATTKEARPPLDTDGPDPR